MKRSLVLVVLAVSTTAWATSGCGPSDEEIAAKRRAQELEAQLNEAANQRQSLEGRIEQITTQNRDLVERLRQRGEDVSQLESERTNLRSTLDETQRALQELSAREAQATARLATFRNMLERFRELTRAGALQVRVVRNRIVVVLPEGVLFDSGQAEIKETGRATLAQVAGILQSIPNRDFQVAGHTDNVPIRSRRFPSNWELSAARAVNVARFLMEQGLDASRLSAAGYAETQPVAANDDDAGRAQNRRIEIGMLPNLDELPDLSSLESSGG